MSWIGGQLAGPESLIDDRGRNIFFGWIADFRKGGEFLNGYEKSATPGESDRAWASVVSLPRVMSLTENGTLGIAPAPELRSLRLNPQKLENLSIAAGEEVTLPGISGNSLEISITIDPEDADVVGVKVFCSPDNSEETTISYHSNDNKLQVDFTKSTVADNVEYWDFDPTKEDFFKTIGTVQTSPHALREGENLKLRIFLDRSVLEVFANGRQCITQRVYPSREDSRSVRLFARGGSAKALEVEAWDMEPVAPW